MEDYVNADVGMRVPADADGDDQDGRKHLFPAAIVIAVPPF